MRRIFRFLTAPFRLIYRLIRWATRKITGFSHNIRAFFTEEPDDRPIGDTLQAVAENPHGLLDHINALRKHLLRALLVLAVTTGISFAFSEQILAWIAAPLEEGVGSLMAIEVTEPLSTLMRISLLSGFVLALPYIVFEIWLFIAPGLRVKTRLNSLLAIPVAVIFFLAGIAFTYYVLLPAAVPFLLSILGLPAQIRPSSYIGFVTSIMFWVGISFEFPLVIFMLASLGVLSYRALIQQWRLAVVLIAVIAAVITPTIDPVNMALVMAPLLVLYLLSIGLAYLAGLRRERAQPQPLEEGA